MSLSDGFGYLKQGLVTGLGGFGLGGEMDPAISFLSFNQDASSLTLGTEDGYKIYSLTSTDKLDLVYSNQEKEVFIAERLFSSSLVAVVTMDNPRTLIVSHFKKGSEICRYSYNERIQGVRMNRGRLVVCLEDSLFIHNIRDMKVLHVIRETPPNPRGLFALSTDSDNNYLAYPGHSTIGELQIFDTVNLYSRVSIPAHEGQLAAMQFSPSGNRIATASDKGTVIRVFNCENGSKLYELRRGLKRTATIYSLAFSPCGSFLACSSNTETVHVFRMEEKTTDPAPLCGSPSEDLFGYIHQFVSAGAVLLPTQMTDTLMQGRAFASVHHTLTGVNRCALVSIRNSVRLLLASQDGRLYIYNLDHKEGGDCSLIQQFQLIDQDNQILGLEDGLQDLNPASPSGSSSCSSSSPSSTTYADRLKNKANSEMTDSDKFHEMESATETPPTQCFLLDDDREFPPV
ncbi:WD repeat domain phosphoinositide-interacting protein 2 [Eurytemora carolleeae]|uniref:WD repeat domain phosphoinositide-interacting protein 2 n=1 Tax=Eurytemora carolleeae TaxID=1294199 RepID=UPI000C787BBD|nr:WD repeat domain phosphoinositide-interacting protein 2 [Eurytemora carolleeae]|eukprot:XP_023321817.1 WD repeat domain phosphoinositide-interacting protein 2-like [Eurytemora affinis]